MSTQGTQVQIFGVKGDADTRKALRFFAERRIKTHFVDFKQKGPSPRELQRFVSKYGVDQVLDRESKRFQNKGLGTAHLSDTRWVEKMIEEPLIIRMPLTRYGNHVSVGFDPDAWKGWLG